MTSPAAVKGLSNVTAIAAGGEFSLALVTGGTVRSWGNDESGELGNSAVEEGFSDLPVTVDALSEVTAVAAGSAHSLALLADGTVKSWGQNTDGELGQGTMGARKETPAAVSGLTGVTGISAGTHDSLAVLGGGAVRAWGINHWGTLGDGKSGEPSDVPVVVGGVAKVASISAGGSHMLAFGEPLPTVSSISPSVGPAGGKTQVTIQGASFTEVTGVHFGSAAASGVTVESPTEVSAEAPAGTGTVDITVTTNAGTSAPTSADRYTYEPAPTITRLSPKLGPASGETAVTITGTGFTGATGVSFAGVAASYVVNSPTTITATSPAGASGRANVTVTTPGGTSATSSKDLFTYKPVVEAVSPNAGSTSGGASVTVTGAGFALGATATTFKFGTRKATGVSCSSSTTCTMTSPSGAAGTINVTATVAKETSPANPPGDDFTYS